MTGTRKPAAATRILLVDDHQVLYAVRERLIDVDGQTSIPSGTPKA